MLVERGFLDDFNTNFNRSYSFAEPSFCKIAKDLTVSYCFFGADLNRENYNNLAKDPLSEYDNKTQLIKSGLLKNNISCQEIALVKQVHGNDFINVDYCNISALANYQKEADAIITKEAGLAIGVATADCLPILVFDKKIPLIASIHCGWRGSIKNIIEKVVLEMNNMGANNLVAIIGPAIQQFSYQVDEDFYYRFIDANIENRQFFIADPSSSDGNKLFDLPAFASSQLNKLGVLEVITSKIDTFSNPLYHSFRRSQKEASNNISGNSSRANYRNFSVIIIGNNS